MSSAETHEVMTALAAMIEGDRALPLESACLVIGETPGTFRQLACKPGFPRAGKNAKRLTWSRRELLDWWYRERDRKNAT
jgi:hypothetical protein